MTKKPFQADSKRLLDLMINSIYTHREIFLRELVSNASDAIDKIYYKTLMDESLSFHKEDYYIQIDINEEERTLKITDTGIGMNREELEDSLGVIARSGSLAFKNTNEIRDGYDIIGQFGVGFYSAFMVANQVTVTSKALGHDEAFQWTSNGADGYEITTVTKESTGTEITLHIKDNTEDENFDEYLQTYRLKSIIKKYSDFIRYPIKMTIRTSVPKEDAEGEYEEVSTLQTVNSMVPIWKKLKSELTDEDYDNFYAEKHYGFDKPLKHIHFNVDGTVSYHAVLFIPEKTPFDFYAKEYEKGLELYANGVMIMNKCADLLPDYFSFVKGMVDSEDLSLNISREMLQHDRQLKLIAKNIKSKIKSELQNLLKEDREKYDLFYKSFGRQLKYGLYSDFGREKDTLQDLLMFYSSTEKKMVTLSEYVSRMPEDQKFIYYAAGESNERIEKLPQTELVSEKGYEILYFTEDVDEFSIRALNDYKEKSFKSVSSGDLGIEEPEVTEEQKAEEKTFVPLFEAMKNLLSDKVKDVRISKRLKKHPVCLSNEGDLSIEMEKILSAMPNANEGFKADKILEINQNHEIFKTLKEAFEHDPKKLEVYTYLLYNQALLIEGLPVQDPVEFADKMCEIMK